MIESRAVLCPKCGIMNDDRAMYCQSCGSTLQAKESADYAGFWIRFVAVVIDWMILFVGAGIVSAITFGGGVIIALAGPWLYEALMMSSEWQATVGKRVMSIIVTDVYGRRISFARATGRHFAKYISAFILFIGFIMAAFTARKQALHDMIAETLVVRGKTIV